MAPNMVANLLLLPTSVSWRQRGRAQLAAGPTLGCIKRVWAGSELYKLHNADYALQQPGCGEVSILAEVLHKLGRHIRQLVDCRACNLPHLLQILLGLRRPSTAQATSGIATGESDAPPAGQAQHMQAARAPPPSCLLSQQKTAQPRVVVTGSHNMHVPPSSGKTHSKGHTLYHSLPTPLASLIHQRCPPHME
jgi:hypothetical protein